VREAGIDLIFVTEPLDKSPEGALIRYVKGYAAEMNGKNPRAQYPRQEAKAREGTLGTAGPGTSATNVQDGRRVINPAEADLVRRIYTWFAKTATPSSGRPDLNREDIPGRAPGKWNDQPSPAC
jgi:DNA invertase Pin-like site-specific DNA recombinase